MLSKAVFLVLLLLPLLSVSQEGPVDSEEDPVGPEENQPSPPAEAEETTVGVSSNTVTEATTSTSSGTSHIIYINALVFTIALLLK